MNEHPDIEELVNKNIAPQVEAHLQDCEICQLIAADVRLLEMNLEGLTLPFKVSGHKNEEILDDITKRSVEIRKLIFRNKTFFRAITAVAALLMVGGIWFFSGGMDKLQPKDIAKVEDFNGDGQVNVIDSFLLAKSLKRGGTSEKEFDLDGDGQTGEKDLVMLRNKIVTLAGGEK